MNSGGQLTRVGKADPRHIFSNLYVPLLWALTALLLLSGSGCSTTTDQSAPPRSDKGYVDFYTDSALGLSWEVKRAHEGSGQMKTVFSEMKPVEGTVLRLETVPGNHEFQVWFNNRVTEGPQKVQVSVESGKVTPVHVTLTTAGNAAVEQKDYGYRSTARASRRVSKISTQESTVYRIGAASESPRSFQPKAQMPYYSPGSK
jgi:hypothetical protein